MVEYDARTKLEALKAHLEGFTKFAMLLIVGHCAGLGYCLSALRIEPPLYKVHPNERTCPAVIGLSQLCH